MIFNKSTILYFLLIAIIIVLVIVANQSSTPMLNENKNGNSIAEFRIIKIKNSNQTILIRSQNTSNPVLLYLHGGPGSSEMVPFRLFHSSLEKYFTVVLWDQRGTGKSYSFGTDKNSMTIDNFISDTYSITKYLLNKFHKNKILIVGHSWGTILGLLFVKKYPELVYAYVGSGQSVNTSKAERISYDFVRDYFSNNQDAKVELSAIDRPAPYLTIGNDDEWFSKIKTQRKWLVKTGGEFYNKKDYSTIINLKTFLAPEYSVIDFIKFGLGSLFSLKSMWPEIMNINLMESAPNINVPVFLLQGRHDYVTPSVLAKEYFENLDAPHKKLIWFERSAHNPMYEEPTKFDEILIHKVLPLCK